MTPEIKLRIIVPEIGFGAKPKSDELVLYINDGTKNFTAPPGRMIRCQHLGFIQGADRARRRLRQTTA